MLQRNQPDSFGIHRHPLLPAWLFRVLLGPNHSPKVENARTRMRSLEIATLDLIGSVLSDDARFAIFGWFHNAPLSQRNARRPLSRTIRQRNASLLIQLGRRSEPGFFQSLRQNVDLAGRDFVHMEGSEHALYIERWEAEHLQDSGHVVLRPKPAPHVRFRIVSRSLMVLKMLRSRLAQAASVLHAIATEGEQHSLRVR